MLDNSYLKFRAAVHETGHALVASKLPFITKINKVIIENKNNKPFGYTDFISQDSWYGAQDAYIVLAAGLAADYICFGKVMLDEAKQDLEEMRAIVNKYGENLKQKEKSTKLINQIYIESIAGKQFGYAFDNAVEILSTNRSAYLSMLSLLYSNSILLNLK